MVSKSARRRYAKFAKAARKYIADGTFANMGDMAGTLLAARAGPAGQAVGGQLGRMAGAGIAKIAGFGDYTVSKNSISTRGEAVEHGSPVPQFSFKDNAVRLCHREFIGDVLVGADPTAFENRSYSINPANAALCPWVSRIAERFQQWRFNGAVVVFVSNTSGYSASGPLGQLCISTNYDSNDKDFTSMSEALNSEFAVQAAPSKNQIHSLECDPNLRSHDLLYTSGGDSRVGSVSDLRLEDLGRLQIMTQGLAGSTGDVLGGLWISYDLELHKPVVSDYDNTEGQKIVSGVPLAALPWRSVTSTGETIFMPSDDTLGSDTLVCNEAGSYIVEVYVANTAGGTIGTAGGTATITELDNAGSGTGAVMRSWKVEASYAQTFTLPNVTGTLTAATCRIAPYSQV